VEFVVSGERPDEAYFLEMNTRLQVEHPVTEMVWGIDLVEQQLRIAAGEPLAFTQADLMPRGHAIEARVYAEDPSTGFLPTGGTIEVLSEPMARQHVRVDSSLLQGGVVGSDYDPMLAKVVAWGSHREDARRRLDAALADTTVLGVTTNIAFLRELLTHPDVVKGSLDTGLIDRLVASRPTPAMPPEAAVAAALATLDASAGDGTWGDRRGWRIGDPATINVRHLHPTGTTHDTHLRDAGNGEWDAAVGDWARRVRVEHGGHAVRLVVDGVVSTWATSATAAGVWVGNDGAAWHLAYAPEHGSRRNATAAAGLTIVSPMPGTVVSIDVAVGQRLDEGQTIAVVEAMKMEHTLRASQASVVREIKVSVGDRVSLHQMLVGLDAAD
jgi:acetyl-CoA/propionyl-CoA carboxylase biotin carboxyl carrier protein